jgi:hypothetical protein
MTESAHGADGFGVSVHAPLHERGRERGVLLVRKWDQDQTAWMSRRLGGQPPGRRGFTQPGPDDFARYGLAPYETRESEFSNVITQAGWVRLLDRGFGGTAQGYDSTHLRLGVGTATAAATTGQTDLQATTGAAARQWKLVGTAAASGAGTGTVRYTYAAAFGTGEANFAWQEWGSDQGTADGTGASTTPLLNRAVSNQGTKASGQTWTATAQLDFS